MSKAIRDQKEAQVGKIKKMLENAKAFVIIDYKGLNVAEDTNLRNSYRKNGVSYHVLKNTLLKIALNELGYKDFDKYMEGTSSLAVSIDDVVAPSKVSAQKMAEFKKMKIKCGMVDGKFLTENECMELSKLPSKEVLIAQLLSMLLAPISSFARAIDAIAKQQESN